MENYGYDPYRYPYQPPPPANPSPHFPPPQQPPYPYNPYHHSSGGSSPPPDPYLSHPAQYPPPPPPPQYYAPPYPSYPSLYPSYQYPNPSAPDLSPNSPPPPPPPSSYQPCRPGHYPHHSGEFYASPPPHSDPFHPSYGQPGAPFEPTPPHHDAEPVNPNLSVAPHEVAYPPIEGMLANVHLSDHTSSSAPATPSLSKPSASFHHRPNNSFSGFSPHTATPSSAITPFSWSQHGGQNASFGHGGSSSNDMQIVPFQPSNTSLKVLLLHGNLDIWIHEARNLPNMDMFSKTLTDFFGRKPPGKLDGSHGHNSHVPSMTSDPYVSFSVTTAVLGRTYVISNSENPVWNQHFYVAVAHHAAEVHFVVKDSDVVGAQLIGTVAIPAEHIYGGAKVAGVYPILGANGKPCKPGATLRLSIQYIPIEMLSMYHNGVGPGPEYIGVPGTYFPLRQGGRVKLYSDAHAPDGCLPDLWLDEGVRYEHGKCWQDMTKAIREARRLIYITGWSVYHKVRLVRDVVNESNWTLGDLLKAKSQEGVRVLLLVWDDPTSRNIFGYQKDGVMQTHDEETRRFFKHSSVNVLLTPRSAGKRHSWMKQQEVGIIYTHHQKTVIVDSDAGYNRRKIVAFVGGLDLCDGRYDTPDHSLFRTLHTLHKDDYHNPTFLATDVGGPREPWHDLHTRIDGPAAYDVLKNFEERWLKAKRPHGIKKLKPCDDALLLIDRIPDILKIDESPYVNDYDPESWHVQIFRSIDSNSVKGFPKNPAEATSKNLVCGKNVLIDMSIHTAYVKAIRAAQHFIYIENQYFLGSSYNWTAHKDLGANNLIPMEIALKIASKIKSHERFSVYIVIPMWPEGVPTGVATQRILYWQNKTMQMMYETIYKALVEVGLENSYVPQDYLNFFCLGNREVQDGNFSSGNPTAANSPSVLALKNRRFMIYVHSKGMIVDDEYLIVGSANINQRSLEGTRDSEIAMGAYQPQHTWARKLYHPHGQIYGFRMSLWAEHIGFLEELFEHPEGLECMRRVRTLGELNWQQFVANEVIEMRGHLLKYPVDVDRQGKVRPLPGCETFPDVGGNICGSFSMVQENLTI